MRVLWINPGFSHYRIPVYAKLRGLLCGCFKLLYSKARCQDSVVRKVESVLGSDAVSLEGERVLEIGNGKISFADKGYRFCYQPGLLRTALSIPADVVIADGFFQWTPVAVVKKLVQRTPFVMCYERTAHTERNAQWYRTAYRKFVMRWIDAMCCNGRLCGEYVRSLGYPANRITYGHMVADVGGLQQSVSSASEAEISAVVTRHGLKGVVFLYVGRLIPLKGIKELLRAWKVFASGPSQDEATLFLVGDGPQRSELEEYCEQNGLRNVRFVGLIDYDKLGPFYKAADVFIMPTLEDNWSLVVPEAMACGLPILCSKYNGCWPELIRPEENGWIFDPYDSVDLAEKLWRCIALKERLPQMGETSRTIVQQYTPEQAAQSILHACELALNNRKGRDGCAFTLQILPNHKQGEKVTYQERNK